MKSGRGECECFNSILGKVKMAEYVIQKIIDQMNDSDVVKVFKVMVISRIVDLMKLYVL